MNEYTKDYGKVGLTFEHYQQGKAVEELTLVAYDGELYVSLRGTVMNANIPTASDDWFKISTFGDLLDAIRQVKAESEQLKEDIEAIKAAAMAVLEGMTGEIESELQSIETRATTAINNINATNNAIVDAEARRVQAENLRKSAETLRAQAEDARILAESLRENKEAARQQAETQRVSEFAGITESWAHLQTSINTTIETANAAAARAVEAAQQVEAVIVRANAAADHANTEAAKIQPALDAMDEEFRSKEAQRDAAVAVATALTPTVNIHDRAISPYSKSNPLPLTHNLATGSILAMEGDMVVLKAQEGWGITRIDREEFGALGLASGDTLLLPMAHFDQEGKPTDNLMLVGAVLFAAEEAVKGQSGEVLYTRRTSLFRATDNAIATWGGVKKWLAIADNESLLICHPLDITSATITRNGNDAANAAADLNQRRRIEEKLNLGGKDPRAWVGMADQLAPSEKTEQAAYRDEVLPAGRILGFAPELGPSGAGTRDGQIADSVSPVMREVSGVSGGGNQAMQIPVSNNDAGVNSTSIATKDGDYYLLGLKGTSANQVQFSIQLVTTKKYLAMAELALVNNKKTTAYFYLGSNTKGNRWRIDEDKTIADVMESDNNVTSDSLRLYYNANTELNVGDTMLLKKMLLLDLTALPQLPATFVASLGQSDAHRVAHALGFLALQRD